MVDCLRHSDLILLILHLFKNVCSGGFFVWSKLFEYNQCSYKHLLTFSARFYCIVHSQSMLNTKLKLMLSLNLSALKVPGIELRYPTKT